MVDAGAPVTTVGDKRGEYHRPAVKRKLLALLIVATLAACSPSDPVDRYVAEFGGDRAAYAQIFSDLDCSSLQATFDLAAMNFDRSAYRPALGFMQAADEQMKRLGCYPWS
jgi:uncharacterized lipoprotein